MSLLSKVFDKVTANTVNTAVEDITNETSIVANRLNETASTSAGTFVNVYDNEVSDSRNEFNSSQQFSPDKTAEYRFEGLVTFGGSNSTPADGDEVIIRVRNITDSSWVETKNLAHISAGTAADHSVPYSFKAGLNNSKTYELQAANVTSSFTLGGGNFSGSYGTITREEINA